VETKTLEIVYPAAAEKPFLPGPFKHYNFSLEMK